MISKLMLRTKIMSGAVSIVVLLMVLSTAIISFIIYGQNKEVSSSLLRQSMNLVKDEMSLINDRLLVNSKQMSTGNNMGNRLKYITSMPFKEVVGPIGRGTMRDMITSVLNISLTAGIYKTAIYNNDGNLLGFIENTDKGSLVGHPLPNGFMLARVGINEKLINELWKKEPSLTGFDLKFQGKQPTKAAVQFMETGQFISLVSLMPVIAVVYNEDSDKKEQQQVGFITAFHKFDQTFVSRLYVGLLPPYV
jgi:hypothetical protein